MDERSYLRVANALNRFGLWTSWCSQFLTPAGFKTIGMHNLERSLRSAGWQGEAVTLYDDIDPGGGFGYGCILIEEAKLGEDARKWLKAVRDHLEEEHHGYLIDGKRSHCVAAVLAH